MACSIFNFKKEITREGKGWSACLLPEGINSNIQILLCTERYMFRINTRKKTYPCGRLQDHNLGFLCGRGYSSEKEQGHVVIES